MGLGGGLGVGEGFELSDPVHSFFAEGWGVVGLEAEGGDEVEAGLGDLAGGGGLGIAGDAVVLREVGGL